MNNILSLVIISFFVSSELVNGYYIDPQESVPDTQLKLLDLLRSYAELRREDRNTKTENDLENWTGHWFPEGSNEPEIPTKVLENNPSENEILDTQNYHRIEMGKLNHKCDDAMTNLTIDWDNSPVNHTCYTKRIVPDIDIRPMIYCEHISQQYEAIHKCMFEPIEYDEVVPLYGTHRPLWPIYGEYKFVPRQRWLHNLEHGAVVMLYHPCANQMQVKLLKSLVKNCLRRHIITPYNLMDEDRPFALVTWGCKLTMSYVDPVIVKQFIQERALRGPEQTSKDGDFQYGLLSKASIVSDIDDTALCPEL